MGKKKKGVIAPIEADPVERLTRIYAMENWMRGGGGGRRGSTLCFIWPVPKDLCSFSLIYNFAYLAKK